MSIRGTKRVLAVRGEEAGSSKRRKPEEEVLWQLRPVSDLKMSSIYNRSASEAPAELFRKDLISAMKLPDSEVLTSHEYWTINDTWKQEWERGVQVPVNPDQLPAPAVKEVDNPLPSNFQEFKLPKNKYIHINRDATYQAEIHQLSSATSKAESACKYDLDAVDSAWLRILNGERSRAGTASITEDQLEKVIQELELRCWDKIQATMKSEEGLGIEYDENVICDVCRSPDSEEGNEMVFCDACNICVHQACYGITTIPSGQWLCRPCGDQVRPTCVLCPNLGGAMKCTPSGNKWAHVSCVLWIPEVSIGCAERMEPITKITAIPPSRWALLCVLCRERKGACIQCSVKTCKTAYHVTCAFKHGLEMRAIIEDENADDGVKLRSYCTKHSVNNSKKEKNSEENSEEDEMKRKRRKDMTSEEKSIARAQRLHEIEAEFDKQVSIKDISTHLLDVDQDAIGYIYSYWKLKRRAGHNRPLLPPKSDESDLMSHRQEQEDLDKMKKFVQLRQDLERVRNLCYMVSRREKLSRSFFRMREQTFHKQVAVLSVQKDLGAPVLAAVIEANHGPSIYDRMYSHADASDNSNDFDSMMACIAGLNSEEDKKNDINGLKSGKSSNNPYKKVYVNGSTRRSESIFSGMSSEESAPEIGRGNKYNKRAIGSSTEEDEKPPLSKKKVSPGSKSKLQDKSGRKKKVSSSRHRNSSSEEDIRPHLKKEKCLERSRTEAGLKALEREMSVRISGSDSDDLMPPSLLEGVRKTKFPMDIYSDSSDASGPAKINELSADKSPNTTNDSTQQLPRTKAAMKQFIPIQKSEQEKTLKNKRGRKPSSLREKPTDSDDEAKNKENMKLSKNKDYPTDLIVPQRQAAKKASENMRSTTKSKDSDVTVETKSAITPEENKSKQKSKTKAKDEKSSVAKDHNRKKNSSADSLEFEKDDKESDMIAYVPQRQAAKKAAAHIKSGLGSKLANTTEASEENKKKDSSVEKRSPYKDDDKQSKCSSRSSSSSTSNTSSSSCSSSSSSDDEDDKSASSKSVEIKPQPIREPSLFSPVAPRPSVDLPFLNKVSRPLSSSSASSDTDSTKDWERSPSFKRGRLQRNESSSVSDESSHKAPDKKFKTSERRTECKVSSPTAEGKERNRTSDARSGSRSRTRSTASCRNLFDQRESGLRKSITDESSNFYGKNKSSETTYKPSETAFAQQKSEATLNAISEHNLSSRDESKMKEQDGNNCRQKAPTLENIIEEDSTKWIATKYQKSPGTSHRRASVSQRRVSILDIVSPTKEASNQGDRKNSDYFNSSYARCSSISPKEPSSAHKTKQNKCGEHSPLTIENSSKLIESKLWSSNADSPLHPTPIDNFRDADKYDSEDKSLDERSSFKMIARIQENLYENTMIKSPKTPMDATTPMNEPIEMESQNPDHSARKVSVSTIEISRKFLSGQGAEMNAPHHNIDTHKKLPPNYSNRSIFSPQPIKETNDFFEFGNNILAVDDSVSDDIMKPFSFNSEFLFKEDSKEDRGVQETLNLVQKLRQTLISKKTAVEQEQEGPIMPPEEKIPEEGEKPEEDTANKESVDKVSEDNEESANHLSPTESTQDADRSQPSNASLAPSNESVDDTRHDEMAEEEAPPTPEPLDVNKWHYTTSETQVQEHQNINYDEKLYQEKQYDIKFNKNQYEEKQYQDTQYGGKQYEDKSYEESTYRDEQYVQSEYEEKQYNEKHYSTKQYDKHPQYHHLERDDLTEHQIPMSNEIQSTAEQEHFRDNVSKHSDDSCSNMEQTVNSNDHENLRHGSVRSQSYDNNNSLPQSDCATISSPYADEGTECKWGESKITQRRSSASSTNSEGSVCSQKVQMKPVYKTEMLQEMEYANMRLHKHLHTPAHPGENIPYSTFSSEASFVPHGTVSLFQPGPSAQLPLQSPGAGLYPPNLGIPYNTTSIISNLGKPFTSMCNAFTTQSQNLVMNTSIVARPTPKIMEHSPPDDMDFSRDKSFSQQPSPSPSIDSFNDASRCGISKLSNDSNDTICTQSTTESQSSTKPMRTNRFIGSGKSPVKSPGFSPKTADSIKSNSSKRSTSGKNRGRGRGRSKTRGGPLMHNFPLGSIDFPGTIHSKLIGTVYELDFEEETANDSVDLKSMRERRRSVDVQDRKTDLFKDSSQSPIVPSPTPQVSKSTSPPIEIKEDILPVTMSDIPAANGSQNRKPSLEPGEFPAIVQPVLPGPVDMRRYQHLETPTREPFQYGSFDTVTTHQPLEFDEESEKEFQKTLASNSAATLTKSPLPEVVEPPLPFPSEPPMPKVSLSDSRNQLKVKIKGPFRDANYCASVQPVVPQPPQQTYEAPAGTPSAVASVSSAMLCGTSNLRRMRKKELLRQYWTQDMNMDDPDMNKQQSGYETQPVQHSPLSRTIITIPKAVASMTTIPTREDYKAVVDANMEKKKRKTAGERELRHLQVNINDDLDDSDDLLPSFSGTLSQPPSRKGRGRTTSTKPSKVPPSTPVTPKLKIKIGSNIVHPITSEETANSSQFRPPKKRLAPKEVVPPTPSYEDLRRESMKFRKMMMAEFDDGKKDKKHKPKGEKTDKKKKKKGKKTEKMEVVNRKSEGVTKLVIKISRNKDESSSSSKVQTVPQKSALPYDPFEYDPAAPDPLAIESPSYSESCGLRKVRASKVTPIRLKLARTSEGSGYVMKDAEQTRPQTSDPVAEESTSGAKCEVR